MHLKLFLVLFISGWCLEVYSQDTLFTYYQKQNESETRLAEFKDSDDALKLKIKQLEVINKSRTRHKVAEVKLDILASRVANKMCREAAENAYAGHWNMAGEKPYHRYAFAGGKDHVSENAASRSLSGDSFDQSANGILENMVYLHNLFMSERAPNDGHKKNCLDKAHNFVGIGYYSSNHEFRYYEEFIDRYLFFDNVPVSVKTNEEFHLDIKTPAGKYLYFLTAYYEDFTKKMKPAEIMRADSYQDFGSKEAVNYTPAQMKTFRKSSNSYSVPLKFKKPGLYYIHIYIDNKEPDGKKGYNTKGKTLASGIVVRVENLR
jgi:uncharacterized protein YkwD